MSSVTITVQHSDLRVDVTITEDDVKLETWSQEAADVRPTIERLVDEAARRAKAALND